MWSVVPAMHLPRKPLTGKVAELFHCVVNVQVHFGVVRSLESQNKLPKCWTIALISRKIASSFCPLLKSLENCCPGGVGRVCVWVCAVGGGFGCILSCAGRQKVSGEACHTWPSHDYSQFPPATTCRAGTRRHSRGVYSAIKHPDSLLNKVPQSCCCECGWLTFANMSFLERFW